jgi:hypothetical protein
MSTWNPTTGGPESIRRRSQRVFVSIAITVRNGDGCKDAPFEEETQTLVVNAHGALIGLAAKIEKGQILRLKNRAAREEQVCKVVYTGPVLSGKAQVGVEFTSAAPDFWHIAFPPEDWAGSQQTSANRENKSLETRRGARR